MTATTRGHRAESRHSRARAPDFRDGRPRGGPRAPARRDARRCRLLLQDRPRGLHVGGRLRAARLDGRARQARVRRPQVLRRARNRRLRSAQPAQPRRHLHDRARQPGDHGSGGRSGRRRRHPRGHRADEPRSRRPRRSRFPVPGRGAGPVARAARAGGRLRGRRVLGPRGEDAARRNGREADRRDARHPPGRESHRRRPEARRERRPGFPERRRLHRRRQADSRCRQSARGRRIHPGDDCRAVPARMSALRNDRLLRALLREPVDRTPVWIMRQAGRYLPEYPATRAKAGSFLGLATNPDFACEVTLQPLARFPLDAAILFSDILMIPKAMGVGVTFEEGEGPRIARPVRSAADIAALPVPDPSQQLRFVLDAVSLIRRELAGSVPLIGFAGSPWTVATYLVEGGSSRDFTAIKGLLYGDPKTLHALLDKLAKATTAYLNAQIEAGAQAVMLFDTWGGALSTPAYLEFSLSYLEKIVAELTREHDGRRVPSILFTKGGGAWLERMAK